MTRASLVLPVVVALVAGAVLGGRLLPAEAQRRREPTIAPGPAACADLATERDRAVRRAQREVVEGRRARELATVREQELVRQLAETRQELETTRARLQRLEKYLAQPVIVYPL